jgi:hypothetical protein
MAPSDNGPIARITLGADLAGHTPASACLMPPI